MTFDAHGNSYAMAINNKGTVRASGFNFLDALLPRGSGRTAFFVQQILTQIVPAGGI